MRRERIEKVEKSVVYALVCDACGKIAKYGSPEDNGWFRDFASYHTGWYNDSSDSYQTHDVCSFPCYVAVVKERIDYW